ncbi:type II secretion system protein [Cellulomonas sp.]|uniref:type IV pilus modification PilV family protein n=2 Tax=Cellulomonas sp. TaxID=40001 RepID=UPI002D713A08|nr:type II secretion system protein [Cellulomonas sp.]HYQ75542.1 type II secretion system protein [Cellulomonas sp.]
MAQQHSEAGGERRRDADAGVGIIEILVAMAIFGIVMAAALPLLFASTVQAARAAQLATASQIANQQLERARSAATSCTQLKAHLASSAATAEGAVHDSRGIDFEVTETAASSITCPDVDGLVPYTVTVRANTNASARPVTATVTSRIWVGKD